MKKYLSIAFLAVLLIFSFSKTASAVTLPSVDPAYAATMFVTVDSAYLYGKITSTGGATATFRFEYGTTPAFGTSTTTTSEPSGYTGTISYPVWGLACHQLYYFRSKVTNSAGSVYGPTGTFTTNNCGTATLATVSTLGTTLVGVTTANVLGQVTNAGGSFTVGRMEYGLTSAYGTVLGGAPGSGGVYFPPTPNGFGYSLTGLACHTVYHYRAMATNGAGTAIAPTEMTFTTLPCFSVITYSSTVITATSATLTAQLAGLGSFPQVGMGVQYGTTTAYGSSAGYGYSPGAWAIIMVGMAPVPVTGLTCATTYHFRAFGVPIVSGAPVPASTTYGADKTFTTLPCPPPPPPPTAAPTVWTDTATVLGPYSVTFNGHIVATGGANAVTVGYNYKTSTTSTTMLDPHVYMPPTPTGSYGAGFSFPLSITGLTCATTYHFRAWATNSAGTGYATAAGHDDLTVTTAACPIVPPTVHTLPATVAGTTATLVGRLDTLGVGPGGIPAASAVVAFNLGGTIIPASSAWSSTTTNFTATTTVLCGTGTYSYFAIATSTGGAATVNLTPVTFAKPACVPPPPPHTPPVVVTVSVTSITATSAVLNGKVTDIGTGYTDIFTNFNYATHADYIGGGYTTATPGSGWYTPGPVPVMYHETITGLACGTAYDFEAETANTGYVRDGLNMSFTTLPCLPPPAAVPPTVTTVSGTATSTTTATVHGSLDTLGTLPSGAPGGSTTLSFQYGTVSGGPYASMAGTPSPSSAAGTAFAANLTSLTSCTRYYYRAKAVNAAGTNYGTEKSFMLECTSIPPSVSTVDPTTAITATGATIHGHLNTMGTNGSGGPGGVAALGFYYGTVASGSYTSGVPALWILPMTLSAPGSFTGTLSGLACNTAYKFYAFANNDTGHGEGMLSAAFTTLPCPPSPPTVLTSSGAIVSSTPAATTSKLIGKLVAFGAGATSAAVGFYYSPTAIPASGAGAASVTVDPSMSVLGSYMTNVVISPPFTCNNPSHVRAWATNAGGTSVGSDIQYCN